jgi:menaquinol-cytochrome c reductase iron-sulfur subunit
MDTKITPAAPAAREADARLVSRRRFLERLSLGLSGILGAAIGVPIVGFLVAPLLRKVPDQWQSVGPIDNFKVGETVQITLRDPSPLPWAGVTARAAAWLRRETQQDFVCFAVNCTHLGCPVRWLPDASLFMCPCHGGVFYHDGNVAAGPPPRPLTQYSVRVRGGQVEVLAIPVAGKEV